ncbi:MAG: preprotein translocase subunit YajC [Polyangiaceae bacterium]
MSFSAFSLQQVAPKAGTPGTAQEGAPGAGAGAPAAPPGGGLISFLPLLMFVPLLFMMFRRQKKEQEQRAKLKKGDRVVSNAGLVGELVELDEKFAKVKIAPGTTVQMLAGSVAPLEAETEKKAAKAEEKPALSTATLATDKK